MRPSPRGAWIALVSGVLAMMAAGILVMASWPVLRVRWQIQRLESAHWDTFSSAYQALIELPEERAGEVIAALSSTRGRCSFPVPDGDRGRTEKPFGAWRRSNGTPPGAPRAAVLTRVFFRLLTRDLIARGGNRTGFGWSVASVGAGNRLRMRSSAGGFPTTIPMLPGVTMLAQGTDLPIEPYENAAGEMLLFPAASLILHPESARDLWRRREEITASWEAFYAAVSPELFLKQNP